MTDVTAPPPGPSDRLLPINIEDEMRASYLDYAMSVIIGRALPDVRDGLKPVHRRVLFAMHELGNQYNRAYKKSARVVGDVIGKYHPHGDSAVYDSLVRMAQDFSMRHLLVDGQGNFGSVDGDRAAAMRYTEVRMAKLASEMLADIDRDTVDFGPNYDESLKEPLVMPTRFPNLLVNGSSGIAVGMATNIPPHNLGEVTQAAIALAKDPSLTTEALRTFVAGPDFPTGGLVYGTMGLEQAYETGRGTIHVRGRASVEEGKRADRIVITEIPYQVNKTTLIERIAEMVREKRLEGISDIRDESNRVGMRIVIELKRDANSDVILNQLYTNTALQSSFGYNMLAIVGGRPRTLGLKALLAHFLNHRRDVVTRRSRFELREARKRFNVVFGLLAAIDAIDKLIAVIRAAPDQATARAELLGTRIDLTPALRAFCESIQAIGHAQAGKSCVDGFLYLNELQAQAILDMRLARLTGLERDKLSHESGELQATILKLQTILASPSILTDVVVAELEHILRTYQEPRRTELVADARQMSVEDLIADEAMVVTVSHAGYIKRNPVDLYQAQRRGGRGKTAATTRDEDFVKDMFVASMHASVLVFTNRGKVYWLKVHEIPQAGRTSRGKPIINLIRCDAQERVAAILPVRSFEAGHFIVMCTERGFIKKTDLMAFSHPRPSGLIATSIDEGDALTHVGLTDGTREILLATRQGLALRFLESKVRAMGRTARGVRGISLKLEGDRVVGMVISDETLPDVLTVCDNGFGKRSALSDYRLTGRGASGVINVKLREENGQVASVVGVNETSEVMVVTNRGMMIRFPVSQLTVRGRASLGNRVITVTPGEAIASVARLVESETAAVDIEDAASSLGAEEDGSGAADEERKDLGDEPTEKT